MVKYRHKVFDFVKVKERCEQLFRAVAQRQRFKIEEIGFDRDHVHVVLRLAAHHSLSHVAKVLKGTSGKALLAEFPEIKRKFWGSGAGRSMAIALAGSLSSCTIMSGCKAQKV